MKPFDLEQEARRTLLEMGIGHPHPHVRRRAQALVRLAQGLTATQVATDLEVHVNSVRGWRRRWDKAGLVGLQEEQRVGRPRKLSPAMAAQLRQVALTEGGTISHIMGCMEQQHMGLRVEPSTVGRWLKEMGFSYKRYRTSLKKSAMPSWWPASGSNSRR